MFVVGTPFPHLFFGNTPSLAATVFRQKFSSARYQMLFYRATFCCLQYFFFNLLYSMSKILLPPHTRVSYKKLREFGHWLTANFTFPAVRWKDIVWSFSMPLWCNKHFPGQNASIAIAFEFFDMFVYTRTPYVFFWGRESCACFRNSIPFHRR